MEHRATTPSDPAAVERDDANRPRRTGVRIFLTVIVSLMAAEFLAELVTQSIIGGADSAWHSYKPIVDAFALALMALPVIYFFVFRPMVHFSRERAEAARSAAHHALFDVLTDLPNRALFLDRLDQEIRRSERKRGHFAVALVSTSGLGRINETLGHDSGDALLVELAQRLTRDLRRSDVVARLGGDEFGLILPGVGIDTGYTIAHKIRGILQVPVVLSGVEVTVDLNVGVVVYPAHGATMEILLRHGQQALRMAQQAEDRCTVYDADKDMTDIQHLTMLSALRETARAGTGLTLHYQPKIHLPSMRTMGVEALARWTHEELGSVSPAKFIPLAERLGLMGALTEKVLRFGFQDVASWRARGVHTKLALNLSARNIQDAGLVTAIKKLCEEWGVAPHDVEFELTESAVIDDGDRAAHNMSALKECGFGLSIDDYGTGQASLKYLSRLPVTGLKVDMSFVSTMRTDKTNAAIVKSTIDLAHNLGLEVTAEGVEDAETLHLLRRMGCDFAQGYYISRAMPSPDVIPWIERQATRAPLIERLTPMPTRATPDPRVSKP